MRPFTLKLLTWYRRNRARYPWRGDGDPYRIWLSEILLQQTRISVAVDYYRKILKQYPSVESLAEADESSFLALWSGAGYYNRARNMLHCAKKLVKESHGKLPSELTELLGLPGVGAYTAGAIRNICFDLLTPAVDGNIARVLSRVTSNGVPYKTRRFMKLIEESFLRFGRGSPSGDYFQSLMELGERICVPEPKCGICPVKIHCTACGEGKQRDYPVKGVNRKVVRRFHWYLLVLNRGDSEYYLQNRSRQFLRHSWIYPDILSEIEIETRELKRLFQQHHGIRIITPALYGKLNHAITFRKLTVHILVARQFNIASKGGRWLKAAEVKKLPTSSITKKVWNLLKRPATGS